ncbi:hypothetical protein A1O1_09015 [Capronia coronata CBS 617.96]|uniref:Uncharacterized protein n=1 Tax=Capronia coronata CBS 617.96 TaxID=1182541 RepID=W9Y882_9EURO|nr:uncharacterized protein A1O1_09015 [Capronia coronata CBS 617.96]EXJ78614.1 hypothetical protein A1O1_09015 [Capronia coronata CBS 617.96]
MANPDPVPVRVLSDLTMIWEDVEAAIDGQAPCRTISQKFLDKLGESPRLNQGIEGQLHCGHHEDFVGKVELRIEGIDDITLDDRAVFCVVRDSSRELVLNLSDYQQPHNRPAILPFGFSVSKDDARRREAEYQRQRREEQEKSKAKDAAYKKRLDEQAAKEEQDKVAFSS